MFKARRQTQPRQQVLGPGKGRRLCRAGNQLRNGHIFHGGEFRQQVMELIYKANADAAYAGARRIIKGRAVLPGDEHVAARRRFQQSGDMQQR